MAELIHTHKGTVYAQRNGVLIPVNTDGLVGYWPMTQGSDLTAYDESKNGNTGTIYGASWTDTANGKALDFDGVDDYVDHGDTLDVITSSTDEMTIAVWIQPGIDMIRGSTDDVAILGKGNMNNYGYLLQWDKWSGIKFWLKDDTGTDNSVGQNTDLTGGQWYHLVATADADEVKIYVNGALEGNTSRTVGNTSNSFLFTIGKASWYDSWYWNGTIDEVRIYDRALSATEISNIYEKTRELYGV